MGGVPVRNMCGFDSTFYSEIKGFPYKTHRWPTGTWKYAFHH